MEFDVSKIRKDFPMLNNKKMQGKDLIYFDNAATSLKPQSVINAVVDYYSNYCANAHRGDYDIAHHVDEEYDKVRIKVSKLINSEPNEVVFTSGTSMSINLVAYGYGMSFLTKDDEILITEAEHASNVLPWYNVSEATGCKVSFIELDDEGRVTLDNLKKALNPHVKIVSLAQVSNVLGFDIDIKAFANEIHKVGAIFVVDGAQSVPHMKLDVKDSNIDFLAFSGHKMLGPTGIGVLYGKYALLDKMKPLMTGGGMNTKFDMCGNIGYQIPPLKFEAGTQNIAGVIGLGVAIDYLLSIGLDNIHDYELKLKKYMIDKLKEVDNLIIYNEHSEASIVTFNVKNVFAQDEATLLNSYGIAVRSGQHCAKILVDKLKTEATVRASLYFYNTYEEIDKFCEVLKKGGDFLDAYFN